MWRVELGYRGAFVTQYGYSMFSTQDYFSQMSLVASKTLFVWGGYSFAPGIAWDYGAASATDRTWDTASLDVHRFSIPLEGRAHVGTWGYAFVRAAPGVAFEEAEVTESTSSVDLKKTQWLFATDVSAGFAARPLLKRGPGLLFSPWLQADVGYGWIVSQRLNLTQNSPAPSVGADFGTLAMQGAFFRISLAASL